METIEGFWSALVICSFLLLVLVDGRELGFGDRFLGMCSIPNVYLHQIIPEPLTDVAFSHPRG